jgi:hypothetical protein
VTSYEAELSMVIYAATKPQEDPCLTGQQADIFVRNFAFGKSLIDPSLMSPDSGLECDDEKCTSAGGAEDVGFFTNAEGEVSFMYTPTSGGGGGGGGPGGTPGSGPLPPLPSDLLERLSWRILSE